MEWDRKTNAIKLFKSRFRTWAYANQNGLCAYCDFPIGDDARRPYVIEHFAPKKYSDLRPSHWRFEPLNLLISCDQCNRILKRQYDPLAGQTRLPSRYRRMEFSVCHPYYDNVWEHIEGGYRGLTCEPQPVVKKTDKGFRTIQLFRLDCFANFEEWMRLYQREMAAKAQLGVQDRALLKEILTEQASRERNGAASFER